MASALKVKGQLPRIVMRAEGPFTAEDLLKDPGILCSWTASGSGTDSESGDEGDILDELIRHHPPPNDAVLETGPSLLTPSKEASGASSTVGELWQATLESPSFLAALPTRLASSPSRPMPSPGNRSRLRHELTFEEMASSPGSKADLFNINEDIFEDVKDLHGKKDELSGLIDDKDLDIIQLTPFLLKAHEVAVKEDEEVDDLFNDFEPEDFAIGLTQKLFSMPSYHHIEDMENLMGSDLNQVIPPSTLESIYLAKEMLSQESFGPYSSSIVKKGPTDNYFVSGKKASQREEFHLNRASELFKDIELHVTTPVTPCIFNGQSTRSSLGGSVLGMPLTSDMESMVAESDVNRTSILVMQTSEASEMPTGPIGFASASGKKLKPPSESSMTRAKALISEDHGRAVGSSSAAAKKLEAFTEDNLMKSHFMISQEDGPSGASVAVGFASASGKKIAKPSEESLKRARSTLEADEKTVPPFAFGFASAGGKMMKGPSRESLRRAHAMGLDREETANTDDFVTISSLKNALNKKRTSKPTFTSLKTLAGKTLGASSRPSIRKSSVGTTSGVRSGRSSVTGVGKQVSFLLPAKDTGPVKDPLKYFDLSPPENRIRLRDLSRNPIQDRLPVSFDMDIDRLTGLFAKKGVDMKLADRKWIENHAELIWWKIVSTKQMLPSLFNDVDLEQLVLNQLLYRYEREINNAQRSILKKICEGDESPVGLFVLAVKDVNSQSSELLLTDGWYSLWTQIDKKLSELVSRGKIRVGQKLMLANLSALSKDPVPILESDTFRLRISYNSTRMCRWHEKLGRKKAVSFIRQLQYIDPEGGMVPCVDLVIVKRYPDIIICEYEDGNTEELSLREWNHLLSTSTDHSKRPASVSKSLKLIAMNLTSRTVLIRLSSVTDVLAEKCNVGRKFRLFNAKPLFRELTKRLELRAFQSARQCVLGDVDPNFRDDSEIKDSTNELSRGNEYDLVLRIIRQRKGENFVWAINANLTLISICVSRPVNCLPTFTPRELVVFKNLEYRQHDDKYNMELFEMSSVSDWERGSGGFELEDHVYKQAEAYFESIVTGKAITGQDTRLVFDRGSAAEIRVEMTVEEYAEEFGETAELIESENEMQVENGCDSMSEDDGGEPGDFQMQDEEEEEEGVALDRKLHDFAPSHGEPVYSIDAHPTDKTLLVTGGGDDWARLLRYEHMTEEFSVVADLGPNTDSIINVKFSVDGKFVATACMDGLVKIYDGVSGAAVQVLEGPNEVVWMDWHPRGHVIAAGAEDGTVWMWNAVSGQCMQVFAGGSMRSTTGCFSPDGKWLVSAGEGIVQVWNPKEGLAELSYDRQQGHPIPEADIISLAVNPASTLIAAGGADGRLVLLSLINWQVRGHLEAHTDAVEGLAFHPNPRLNFLVSAGLDGRLLIWDLNGLQIRAQCKTAEGEEITGVRWLSDPDTFITSAVNGLVSVWDGRSGAKLDQMGLGGVPCLAVAPIPTMNLLFCAYDNGRVVSFAYN